MKEILLERKSIHLFMGVLLSLKKHQGLEFQLMIKKNLDVLKKHIEPIKSSLNDYGIQKDEDFKKLFDSIGNNDGNADPSIVEFLSVKESINLHTIDLKHIPSDINGFALDSIWPVIEGVDGYQDEN